MLTRFFLLAVNVVGRLIDAAVSSLPPPAPPAGKRPSTRATVQSYFETVGSYGATSDEIENKLGIPHQSVSARVHDLRNSGAIVPSGKRRLTRSGRPATVYVSASLLPQ